MDEDDGRPPGLSLEQLMKQLDRSRAVADAGRTVSVESVLAKLEAVVVRIEAAQIDAA